MRERKERKKKQQSESITINGIALARLETNTRRSGQWHKPHKNMATFFLFFLVVVPFRSGFVYHYLCVREYGYVERRTSSNDGLCVLERHYFLFINVFQLLLYTRLHHCATCMGRFGEFLFGARWLCLVYQHQHHIERQSVGNQKKITYIIKLKKNEL